MSAGICLAVMLLSVRVSAADQGSPAEMLRYKLVCSLDEERSSIECEAEVWIRLLRDSLTAVDWVFPPAATIVSIQDAYDTSIPRTGGPAGPSGFYTVNCPIPPDLSLNDSVMFRFRYTVAADTSSSSDIFINAREFLLLSGPHAGWVPLLAAPVNAPMRRHAAAVLQVLAPSQFTMFAGGTLDSLYSRDGNTVWRIVRSDVTGWEESFCIAGSKDVRPRSTTEEKGRCRVSLYTSPDAFAPRFADSIIGMLGAAARYYAAAAYRPRFDRLTFVCIGTQSVNSRPVLSGNLVLFRSGPEYAVFDSSIFSCSANNMWLHETARVYAFDVPDSSYWFNEGWAGYLATRFLLAQAATNDRLHIRERSQLLAHALDFYPTYPIAAGRTSRMNEDAVFRYKGRYVFMMLEYVLGTETFDAVMRTVYDRSLSEPPGITALQSMCESAYGSSLGWFFDQWLRRTGFPEYLLSSQITATPRGTFDVSVSVTQRGDLFAMPLNVYFETPGRSFLKRIFVREEQQRFSYILPSKPLKIDWNPQYLVLRWIPRYRILAHARTSTSYRVFNRDLSLSETEAQLTLQLDPDNNVGANGIALFSLGKAAAAMRDWTKAADYFLRASLQRDPEWDPFLPLLSVVRRANILEVLGNRTQALVEYRRAMEAAEKNPLLYGPVITEAKRFIDRPFAEADGMWYENY